METRVSGLKPKAPHAAVWVHAGSTPGMGLIGLTGTAESPRKPLRHSSHARHYTEGRAEQALAEWLEVRSS